MTPWTFESKDFSNKQWKNLKYVSNDNIESFMHPNEFDKKLFLIGTKGCGKTLLLHKMAYEYFNGGRNNAEDGTPPKNLSNQLVEVLAFANLDPSDTTILELKDHNRWKDIWTFALSIHTLRVSGEPIPKILEPIMEELAPLRQIRYLVPHLLNNYDDYHFQRRVFRHNNLLTAILSEIQDRYVLFLDGLDQALNRFLTSSSTQYKHLLENDPYLMYTVWESAQFGLLLACTDITKSHNHRLVVFATSRKEAFLANDPMAINIMAYCVELEYTDEQLREIFRNNIRRMGSKHCYGNKRDSLETQMFGCEEMAHFVPKNGNGEFACESGIDLILRHTFRRPREVVLLGSRLYTKFNVNLTDETSATEQNKKDIRNEVHKKSNEEILAEYKKEIFPAFREDFLKDFLKIAKSNVLTRQELEQVPSEIVDYLFQVGLLGFVNGNTQEFKRTISLLQPEKKKIPYTDFYIVHPCLDLRFQDNFSNEEFYYEHCIIGHGLPFVRPERGIETLIEDKSVGFFDPNEKAGRKGNEWKAAKIFVEKPTDLFNLIFIGPKDKKGMSRLAQIMRADKLLTQLLLWWGTEKVEEAFQRDTSALREKILISVSKLKGNIRYETKISDLSPASLDYFSSKIFGRITLAGMVLALGFDSIKSRSVLTRFDPSEKSNHKTLTVDTAYLRHAFFLAYLPENSLLDKDQSSKLWYGLSDFERVFLSRWFHRAVANDLCANGNFSDDEYRFLKERLLKIPLAKLVLEDKFSTFPKNKK